VDYPSIKLSPEFTVQSLHWKVNAINFILHVTNFLQQIEGAVELIECNHIQFQTIPYIRPIQDGRIQLFLQ